VSAPPPTVQQTQGRQLLFWKTWIEAAQFRFEAQSVIAMRLLKIATGGQAAAAECTRMVLEKVDGEQRHTPLGRSRS
jgi:hypothetical protein